METMELKCKKLKMSMVPYFPGLAMKATSVIFWKAIKWRKNGANVSIWYILGMAQTAEYHENLSEEKLSIETIAQMVIKVEREYIAQECRESFITTLIEEAEGANKIILKNIKGDICTH